MFDTDTFFKSFNPSTKDLSLDVMKFFMNSYDNFERKMNFIHIAGTNGKGSCVEILSNILISQGYKVGKFLSPHLIKYNERISINGKEISNEEMETLITEVLAIFKNYRKRNITFFEIETIIGLLYFYRNNVDFVILETGLGGLFDCTNIITKPLVSIITSVGYDHMHVLGNTLPEIAYQKAGIIKENSNTVIFSQIPQVNDVFIDKCSKMNNNLHIVAENDFKNYSFDNNFQYFDFKNLKNLSINLKGKVQVQNTGLCLETISILKDLGFSFSLKNIQLGLKSVVHKGRMEILNKKPLLIFDGAHNEPAIKNLQSTINMYYKDYKKVFIISILKRKNYKKMLQLLSEDTDALFILTSGDDPDRYASKEELYACSINYIDKNRLFLKDLSDAIEFAMNSNFDTVSLIVGSFYVYGSVVKKLKFL